MQHALCVCIFALPKFDAQEPRTAPALHCDCLIPLFLNKIAPRLILIHAPTAFGFEGMWGNMQQAKLKLNGLSFCGVEVTCIRMCRREWN
jgi:hypothetical protein